MKKRLLGWLLLFTMLFSFSGCLPIDEILETPFSCLGLTVGPFEHPTFKTNYTKEEHIERITARTEEILAEEIANGEVEEIFVDIVYAFYDDDPEYFLVEVEFKEEKEYEFEFSFYEKEKNYTFITKYIHLVGFIRRDVYLYGLMKCPYGRRGEKNIDTYMPGKSPYTICGYRDEKKYYGSGSFAVQTDEGLLRIYNARRGGDYAECIEKSLQNNPYAPEIVGKDEFYDLMSGSNDITCSRY